MERKFKVGDRVKDVLRNVEGVVESVAYDRFDDNHSVLVCFDACDRTSYRQDGTELNSGVRLVHIDPPAPVLTEWQEKNLRALLNPIAAKIDGDIDAAIKRINDILSEPEPPKWEPKEGEVCLFRYNRGHWVADRFERIVSDGRFETSTDWFDQCRPFSIDLIGTTDNP